MQQIMEWVADVTTWVKDRERRGTLRRKTVTPPIAMGSKWFYLSGDKAEAWVPKEAGAVEYARSGPFTSPLVLAPARAPKRFALGDHCKFCGRLQLSSTSATASDGRTVFERALCPHPDGAPPPATRRLAPRMFGLLEGLSVVGVLQITAQP